MIIWLKKGHFGTPFLILRYTAAILDFQKLLQLCKMCQEVSKDIQTDTEVARLVVHHVIIVPWPNYVSFWQPFWIFLYLTAILNSENDESVFFVPQNV